MMNIQGSVEELLQRLAPLIDIVPRREAGDLVWNGQKFEYVDLHSFYYQFKQIFGEDLYNFDAITETPRIIDCGAHVGLASLYFLKNYPHARLTSFEADPLIFQVLERNLFNNGCYNVVAEQKAIWTHEEGVGFNSTADDSGAIRTGGARVPSVRLCDLLAKEGRVDLLKMDIEGAEYDVVLDCADVLFKVDRLIIELHVLNQNEVNCPRIGKLLSLLEKQRFRYILNDLHYATWVGRAQKPPFRRAPTDRFICTVFAWKEIVDQNNLSEKN
ncbi:FkbM family methyltransferase [Kiloniella laminariae]|uniref:FkbM family methyltransferase n=1 Tax=Kiloniella laminariae TaxID=454162 RepID=UPI0003A01E64|nr:FkbM family methyltransferase [Kiloniella laminariae]